MIELSIQEFFFRTILESFLLILAAYLLSYKSINKKLCFISAILLSLTVYLVRMLPIYYGVHTIINIMIYILLLVSINKITIIKAIPISLGISVILSMCEFINFIVIERLLKIKVSLINNSTIKILCFMPSLLLFALILLIFYKVRYKNKKEGYNNVFN
ncbi:hypothetical protein CLOACE_20730 [Clostridium acetireducens DSM 10703]|uniref:Uncharacterized protein n=1 Tax=Clostridium acetireducens DSM 10703 TaxID=1121290 RepID=A0A1E8EWN6_9CLOT|nr:hypothetical protein [Clostridium acetireducens]OFI01556.1 hypothetical protein CLOACE_20730 [Clostridium acetireducens DSM 10703]